MFILEIIQKYHILEHLKPINLAKKVNLLWKKHTSTPKKDCTQQYPVYI